MMRPEGRHTYPRWTSGILATGTFHGLHRSVRTRRLAIAAVTSCIALSACAWFGGPSLVRTVAVGTAEFPPVRAATLEDLPPDSLLEDVAPSRFPRDASAWVDSVMGTLTLRDKAAQMVVPFTYAALDGKTLDALRAFVRSLKVGGVILSRGTVDDARRLVDTLQSWSNVPLLISADFENGAGMRLDGATEFPSMMALGATRNPDLAYAMGRCIADEARAVGVRENYAPVADVNNNPANPIVNVRSFGGDPALVAAMTAAYARGLQDGRVIATVKHFPGHGDTEIDSHTRLPSLPFDRPRLDSVELLPFRRAVESGVLAVMTGHLAVPELDAGGSTPATLSARMLDTLLRADLGFRGLVVSDALNMKALAGIRSCGALAKAAVAAGVDVLLMPADPVEAVDSIAAAVARGELPEELVNASVRRILAYKQWTGLARRRTRDADADTSIGSAAHRNLAMRIARRAMTLVRNDSTLLPLPAGMGARVACVAFTQSGDRDPSARFLDALRARLPRVAAFVVGRRCPAARRAEILDSLRAADLAIFASFLTVHPASDEIALSPDQAALARLASTRAARSVLVTLGSPYVAGAMPWTRACLCAYGHDEGSIDAAVEALFGDIPTRGILPVRLPGIADAGTGLALPHRGFGTDALDAPGVPHPRFARVDSLVERMIGRRAFPGAELVVGTDSGVIYRREYGTLSYAPGSPPVERETMYDLASLTKVVATVTCAMKLVEEGKLSLDAPVARYLPSFGRNGKERVTIRNLLLHNAGLVPFRLYYTFCRTAAEVLDSIYAAPLEYPTGTRTVYSDLGMIVLGKAIEAVTGETLDAYARSVVFAPLGMAHTMFRPPDSLHARIAPTERDTVWRKRLVQGTVHDETAAMLGGVAGHAGLFSTASDLARFARAMLDGGALDGVRILRKETVERFTKRQSPGSSRALGWDTRSSVGSSAGTYFSTRSFGHTGFTGTSIWIDPDARIFVIFLANRVHPTRENRQLIPFRAVLHDAIREALLD